MAYIRKIANGWRAEVQRKGIRKTQVFPTKAHAQQWAAQVEGEILRGAAGVLLLAIRPRPIQPSAL